MKYIKMYENHIFDEKIKLKKCLNYIKTRFKKKNNPVFIYWIAKIFKINNIFFVSKIEMSENIKDVDKVYIKIDDKFYDEIKIYDKKELMDNHNLTEFNFKDLVFKDDITKLNDLIKIQKNNISDKSLNELKYILQKIKDF